MVTARHKTGTRSSLRTDRDSAHTAHSFHEARLTEPAIRYATVVDVHVILRRAVNGELHRLTPGAKAWVENNPAVYRAVATRLRRVPSAYRRIRRASWLLPPVFLCRAPLSFLLLSG
jgi:hypothetical protein